MSKETEEDREVFEKLRERLLDLVSLYGLSDVEKAIGITICGVRSRCWDKDVVIEIGEDVRREK